MSKKQSNIVCNVGCPTCQENNKDSTGNHLMVFKDGGARCIKEDCDHVEKAGSRNKIGQSVDGGEDKPVARKPSAGPKLRSKSTKTLEQVKALSSLNIPSRKLKAEYLSIFGIKVEVSESNGQPVNYYFPRHRDGTLIGYKQLAANTPKGQKKKFGMVGEGKDSDIFGQHLEGGRRMLILTEGEFDAVAVSQSLAADDTTWRVASLPNGANTTFTESSFQWIDSFETIKVMTDMDADGDRTAEELAEMFPGKVERVMLPEKDANDCVMNGKGKDIKGAINNARKVNLGGIVSVQADAGSMIKSFLSSEAMGIPFPSPFEALNEVTIGMQTGKLDIIGSGVGQGKTTLQRTWQYDLTQGHDEKIGVLSFEETNQDIAIGQLSIAAEKPLHHPKVRESLTEKYMTQLSDKVFAKDNLYIIDHASDSGIGDLYSKLKFMKAAYGVKYFFLDPLGMIVKGVEHKDKMDDNNQIESVMRNLAQLCKQLDIYICIVSHGRKASSGLSGLSFERGGTMDLDDLMGSSAIKQYSHSVYVMSRDQGASDPIMRSTVLLTIRKNRPLSITGDILTYMYDLETGLLQPSPISVDEWHEQLGQSNGPPRMKGKGKD